MLVLTIVHQHHKNGRYIAHSALGRQIIAANIRAVLNFPQASHEQ